MVVSVDSSPSLKVWDTVFFGFDLVKVIESPSTDHFSDDGMSSILSATSSATPVQRSVLGLQYHAVLMSLAEKITS